MIKKFLKQIIFIFLPVFGLLIYTGVYQKVYASYITTDASLIGYDSNLVNKQDYRYSVPDSLVIVLIESPSDKFAVMDTDWYKGIHYFQVTRYKYPNVSFHYVVTEDGKLITNPHIVTDQKINYSGELVGESPIVIAHFVKKGSIKFNPIAKARISNIVIDKVNQNAIPQDSIYIKLGEFRENETRQLSFNFKEAYKSWEGELEYLKDEVSRNYNPIQRKYNVQVLSLILPQYESEVDSIVDAQIKLKNIGQFGIYGSGESQILLTRSGEYDKSIFYIPNEWIASTQISLLSQEDMIMPAEEKIIDFKIHSPIDKGEVSEVFKLENVRGDILEEEIVISLSLKEIDADIVEIAQTDTGYLNVRDDAKFGAEEVTRVSPGERYFVLERKDGWIRIRLEEDLEGWVFGQYTKKFS